MSEPIYPVCRNGECGRRHNPLFRCDDPRVTGLPAAPAVVAACRCLGCVAKDAELAKLQATIERLLADRYHERNAVTPIVTRNAERQKRYRERRRAAKAGK